MTRCFFRITGSVVFLTEKNKKIAAAAYEYKTVHRYANDSDKWGEIRFDFSAKTAQIVKLTDGNMSKTNVFAKIASVKF